ncbi:hypothetical protein [Rubrivivax gelatinosus]|uniref:hypothetical protein n=1 Tax=Rubrivivax gelatinosus TaxID=28068 RepID=UPI001042F1DA|nr:hypothetical protein [Rubrivivax gelatinosus]
MDEHSQAFRGMPFKRVFYRLLGGDAGPPLEALTADERTAVVTSDEEGLRLSMPTPVIECGHEFELLLVPAAPVAQFDGELVLRRLNDDGEPVPGSDEVLCRLGYRGPGVSRLRLELPAVARPGPYELQFVGKPRSSTTLRFAAASLPKA